jgi:capsular exopolysaccharide synthesis family protein
VRVLDAMNQDWPVATEVRKLQSRLWRQIRRDQLKVILVTSAVGGEGKTTTVAYLAATSALHPDRRVLAVDFDFRRPQLHRHFEVRPKLGLAEVLGGRGTLDEALTRTELPSLDLLLAGSSAGRPGSVLDSPRLDSVVETLRERYDLVLLDAPPLVPVADASILVPLSDGVLLVVMAGKTPKPHLARARELCLGMGGNILGLVVGNAREAAPDYYHPKYYYEYGNARAREGKPR